MSDYNSFTKRNSATATNPFVVNDRTVAIHQTVRGSGFYYGICAVMGATAIGILATSKLKPRTDRIFFYLSAALTFTACIAYFSMGSNLGWTPIDVEWLRSDPEVAGRNRQVFYARYIDVSLHRSSPMRMRAYLLANVVDSGSSRLHCYSPI
jgi:bacteriorhodopsin